MLMSVTISASSFLEDIALTVTNLILCCRLLLHAPFACVAVFTSTRGTIQQLKSSKIIDHLIYYDCYRGGSQYRHQTVPHIGLDNGPFVGRTVRMRNHRCL